MSLDEVDSVGRETPVDSPDRSPSAASMANEDRIALLNAMGGLPEDYTRAIKLAYFDQLPRAEMAELLGRTEPATRMLLARALAKVGKRLGAKRLDSA